MRVIAPNMPDSPKRPEIPSAYTLKPITPPVIHHECKDIFKVVKLGCNEYLTYMERKQKGGRPSEYTRSSR